MPPSLMFPAEWMPHDAVWTAWPSDAALWIDNLDPARIEVADFIRAVARPDPDNADLNGEMVRLLYRGAAALASLREHLADLLADGLVEPIEAPIGDVWLRDTAPIFTTSGGVLGARAFAFNGWGHKFDLPSDDKIAAFIAERGKFPLVRSPIVLEGGAIDGDGEGTVITTRQCLLNRNRNPGLSERDLEAALAEMLGIEKVLWLDEGLVNDHTDGHVDNIARFINPGQIVCMRPTGEDDPNARVYAEILRALDGATDAGGRSIEIIEIPSPGLFERDDDQPAPASHINFYIANHSLIVPFFGQTDEQEEAAEEAVDILSEHIDREHVYAIESSFLLTGGGSFHCITQQQPSLSA